MKKSFVVLSAFLLLLPSIAIAETIDFEDLAFDHANEFFTIPDGYAGFNWVGTNVLDPKYYKDGIHDSTYGRGIVSGTNVAVNSPNMSITSDSEFNFIGAYFTNASMSYAASIDATFSVEGLKDGVIKYSQLYALTDDPVFYTFNFFDIDAIYFTTYSREWLFFSPFAMDDFTYTKSVPDASTISLLSFALLGLAAFGRKTSRRRIEAPDPSLEARGPRKTDQRSK